MRTVAGRYLLEARIGVGGMGEVYRARHLDLGKAFALKVIAPAFAEDAHARDAFHSEVRLASELSHPNIVSIVDYGEDAELGSFMVMELVEGDALLDQIAQLTARRALDVLGQVADALEYIHKRGIIHGDVKADNIMIANEPAASSVRRRREVRLLDFGLARRAGREEHAVGGSPHYLAPERAAGGPATIATDIYALGVLGYLLFTKTLPFDGDTMYILMAQIERVPDPMAARIGEPIDPAIDALITRAMSKDPDARPRSAAAFRYEVDTVMDMLAMGRRRARPPRPTRNGELLAAAFQQAPFAQALVTHDGRIVIANRAFADLADIGNDPTGHWLSETAIAHAIPSLLRTVERAPRIGRTVERRVQIEGGDALVLWAAPAGVPEHVHLAVRVERHLAGGVPATRDSAGAIG